MIGFTVEIKAYNNPDDYNVDYLQYNREKYEDILFEIKHAVRYWPVQIRSICMGRDAVRDWPQIMENIKLIKGGKDG